MAKSPLGRFKSVTTISVIVVSAHTASTCGDTNVLPSTYRTAGAMAQMKSRLSLSKNGISAAITVAENILPRSNMFMPPSVEYNPEPSALIWLPVIFSEPYPDNTGTVIWGNAFSTNVSVAGRLVFVVSTEQTGERSRALGVWNRTPIQRGNGIWYIQLVTSGVCILDTAQIKDSQLYPGKQVTIGNLKFVVLQPDTVESKVLIIN